MMDRLKNQQNIFSPTPLQDLTIECKFVSHVGLHLSFHRLPRSWIVYANRIKLTVTDINRAEWLSLWSHVNPETSQSITYRNNDQNLSAARVSAFIEPVPKGSESCSAEDWLV